MHVLVVAEHDHDSLRSGSRAALGFAADVAGEGGTVEWLVLGDDVGEVAGEAARFAPVLVASHPALAHPTADRWGRVIADVVQDRRVDLVAAAASTFSRDILSRAGGLLGGTMASEVTAHRTDGDRLLFERPMYAGAVTATVTLTGHPLIVTVRPTAYDSPAELPGPAAIPPVGVDPAALPSLIEYDRLESRASHRPDVTEARVVVSGGRAFRSADDYETLVGGLADRLGAATGSSRALVDAGITPNALQVGQTGKIVAPELYVALGISGAVQHLAGMKHSRVIVAVNSDADAPIFEVADYGIVGDVYQLVPELIELLDAG